MYQELFSSFTGILSLGVIVFVLIMAAFFMRLFLTAKPQESENK